jgi:uncharacterized protein YqgC (DUF456 family)
VLFVVLGLALLGELLEFLAGMLGVARVKGTTRSAAFALIGTLIGSVVGLVVSIFIPIPVIAQLVLAILFSSFGAMIGAILGEWKEGVSRERLSEVGRAAFVGRVLGTVSKVVVGGVMVVFVMMVLTIQGIQALL